ncbi:polymorphic toxin-type HINT domain-containing protein [Streptomyces sp. NPDC051546]|uniref:polymorphic toxin-type HINT domain-containing protein n=1 Tax=Streptomyces sp. NPDC051546 TaxID=3365655 RepID=UPI0037A74F1A
MDASAASLATAAAKPGADVKALAIQGRQLAMKALKLRGAWSQEAAATALSGTDQEVMDYLKTGWKRAGAEEIRDRVVQLTTLSPSPKVRSAAVEVLKGTPQQVSDFYTTGQYLVGADDLAVQVSQINSAGGPGVKDASKAALADGSGKALATFIAVGQYGARLSDDEVTASKLVTTGGPEVQSAAKIALAGPADQLRDFVEVGQFMADRKDQLAANHVNQVERLIAEGLGIAAKAMENAWRAAEAAARANQANAEADEAGRQAVKSAQQAGKHATDAKNSADAAQTSAGKAAQSAATARSAAARADRDADAAEESAAQAEFSAQYARDSAYAANESAAKARQSALDAGKSATEAADLAIAAWNDVQKLREKEAAEARRKAEEERKQKAAEEKSKQKRRCVPHPTREEFAWRNCLMAPGEAVLEMPKIDPTLRNIVWELTGLNDIKKCIQDPSLVGCTIAVISVIPVGKSLKVLKWGYRGIEGVIDSNKFAKLMPCSLVGDSFPAGTPVVMADGSSRPIEDVRISDMVLSTDPESGVTGPRKVLNTIYTPEDGDFTDITLDTASGGGKITVTNHHLFWTENTGTWTAAGELKSGDTLRTPEGGSAVIGTVDRWTTVQAAYNLTINELHTYYVLAAGTPVLVHNASCLTLAARYYPELAHTFKYHAGITVTEARNRAMRIGQNSVFTSKELAQEVANDFATKHAKRIDRWMRTERTLTKTFDGQFGRESLGKLYKKNGDVVDVFDTGSKYIVQLCRDGSAPGGWYIRTIFPV